MLSAIDVYVQYLKRICDVMFDTDDRAQVVNQFDSAHEPLDNVRIQQGGVVIRKARVPQNRGRLTSSLYTGITRSTFLIRLTYAPLARGRLSPRTRASHPSPSSLEKAAAKQRVLTPTRSWEDPLGDTHSVHGNSCAGARR